MIIDFWHKIPRPARELIITLLIGILTFWVGWTIYYYSTYSAVISLSFTPSSATATLNNLPAKSGDNRVKPGDYDVKIAMDGFTTYTTKVSVKTNETKLVYVALESNSADTANYYSDNPDEAMKREGIGDANFEIDQQNSTKVLGLEHITDRGVDSTVVNTVWGVLGSYFDNTKKDNPHAAKQVSLDPDIDYSVTDDATKTYTIVLTIDGKTQQRLTVVVSDYGLESLTLANPDGSNPNVLYDTANEMDYL